MDDTSVRDDDELDPTPEASDDLEADPDAESAADRRDAETTEGWAPRDQERSMTAAAAELRQIEWLSESKWKDLNEFQRRAALNEAGRILGKHLEWPAAPLITKPLPETSEAITLGETPRDGFEIDLNEKLVIRSDLSVREAFKTYCHEYRHTWQQEVVAETEHRIGKPNEDPEKIAEWYDNMERDGYVGPERGMDEYQSQAVERDSREFAERMESLVYGTETLGSEPGEFAE